MKRFFTVFLLRTLTGSALAKTHSDVFSVPCTVLWAAVKGTLRNSGKYGIIGIDNTEMTASYNIGGFPGGKRINSLVLNDKGNDCEMQTQTAFSGLAHDDAGDLKKRVEESLAKLQSAKTNPSVAPQTPASPPAAPTKSPAQQGQGGVPADPARQRE